VATAPSIPNTFSQTVKNSIVSPTRMQASPDMMENDSVLSGGPGAAQENLYKSHTNQFQQQNDMGSHDDPKARTFMVGEGLGSKDLISQTSHDMYGSNRQKKINMDDSLIQKSALDSGGLLECLT
jgi:hypothetical protein